VLRTNGLEADAEFIGYDRVVQPDGLFICWSGQKASVALTVNKQSQSVCSAPLSQLDSKSFKNFFRAEPYDELNAKLLEAAKQDRYDILITHLFEQDRKSLLTPESFYKDQLFENRLGMQAIVEIFASNTSFWHSEGRTSVLELGGGGGFLAYKLAQLGYNVTVLDASAARIFAHQVSHPEKRPGLSIRFVIGVSELLPFGDAEFDFIVSQETLEHVFDVGKTLSEICRVAKPGAQFFHQIPKDRFADGSNHLRHFSKEIIGELFNTPPMCLSKTELIPYLTDEQPNNWFISGTIAKTPIKVCQKADLQQDSRKITISGEPSSVRPAFFPKVQAEGQKAHIGVGDDGILI